MFYLNPNTYFRYTPSTANFLTSRAKSNRTCLAYVQKMVEEISDLLVIVLRQLNDQRAPPEELEKQRIN